MSIDYKQTMEEFNTFILPKCQKMVILQSKESLNPIEQKEHDETKQELLDWFNIKKKEIDEN
jgi:hypothetical protein